MRSIKFITILFWATFMNEQTQKNIQRGHFLKNYFQNPKGLPSKAIRVTLIICIVDAFKQVKAKFNTNNLQSGRILWDFFRFDDKIKRLWNIYKYINSLSGFSTFSDFKTTNTHTLYCFLCCLKCTSKWIRGYCS